LQPESLETIIARYDAFLIDLWGVMHDGTTLYPGAAQTIDAMRNAQKRIVFLSNAPRRSSQAENVLTQLGIARDRYDAIITSGEAAHYWLMREQPFGLRYYYLGPSKDENVISDLPYERVNDPAQADFILNSGFEFDYQPTQAIEPLLERLLELNLPLLCINPDMEVVKQDGTRLLCAGWVAKHYEDSGGTVEYVGKPYPLVYETCFKLLENPERARILAIGDNLYTDIRGANDWGIDSLLITGGILTSECGHLPDAEMLAGLIDQSCAKPTYILPAFSL
jgi:HAD superfamily hydrolase (TIGR01459 family)